MKWRTNSKWNDGTRTAMASALYRSLAHAITGEAPYFLRNAPHSRVLASGIDGPWDSGARQVSAAVVTMTTRA
jgi:hypothetical protein